MSEREPKAGDDRPCRVLAGPFPFTTRVKAREIEPTFRELAEKYGCPIPGYESDEAE